MALLAKYYLAFNNGMPSDAMQSNKYGRAPGQQQGHRVVSNYQTNQWRRQPSSFIERSTSAPSSPRFARHMTFQDADELSHQITSRVRKSASRQSSEIRLIDRNGSDCNRDGTMSAPVTPPYGSGDGPDSPSAIRSVKQSSQSSPRYRSFHDGKPEEECGRQSRAFTYSQSPSRNGGTTPKCPELLITLSSSENLTFATATVNKARNLWPNANVFVRMHLLESGKLIVQKQTNFVKSYQSDCEFKQAFVVSLSKERLNTTQMLIELFEHDLSGKERKTGEVLIGQGVGGTGAIQWLQMCKHPNLPCSMWHSLNSD